MAFPAQKQARQPGIESLMRPPLDYAPRYRGSGRADIDPATLARTFATNVFGYFFLTQAVRPRLRRSAAIINTTSVTACRGSEHLVDYAATAAPSSPSPARWRPSSWRTASASTASHRARSGRR